MVTNTIQNTLSGDSLIDVSIQILRDHEPEEGYYVAFSGGKDSIVVYDLVKRSGVKHDVHFSQTTIDPPEVYAFIREHYPEVIWEKPKRSMFAAIEAKKLPPTSLQRYCCAELKELHGRGRKIVTGIRHEESGARKDRLGYEQSRRNKKTWFCNPIISWTTDDVWSYIRSNELSYPSLYDQGYDRIGCIMCPLASYKSSIRDAVRYPKHYKSYLRSFKKMLENRDNDDTKHPNQLFIWRTPEDVMYWFIYRTNRGEPHPEYWLLPTDPGFDLKKILEKRR